jgi:cyclohexyl-isocyanide hydratase
MATRQLIYDENFVGWIRTAEPVKYKVSVCTGALLWGAAEFIKNRTITTNPLALELLTPYCKEVVRDRAFRDGDVFTGGGITTSVDLGLYFIESILGKETAEKIAEYLDYPYYQARN